jgi:hypothetical protein
MTRECHCTHQAAVPRRYAGPCRSH